MADWLALVPLQLIVDLLFFGAILLLLQRLHRRIAEKAKVVDPAALEQFQTLLRSSQASADLFLNRLEEEVATLQRLAHRLEEKEKALTARLAEAERVLQRPTGNGDPPAPPPCPDRNEEILALVRQGIGREEIARRTGCAFGEIDLIIALDRAGRG